MFDHTHYVPILRWKRAERGALTDLPHSICDAITPLFEPTTWAFADTKKRKTLQSKVAKIAGNIFQLWGEDPFFMDFWLVPPSARAYRGEDSFLLMAEEARSSHVHLIPVTGLDRDPGYQSAVRQISAIDGFGVCLRISLKNLETAGLAGSMTRVLSELGVQRSDVDLILDIQRVEQTCPSYSVLIGKVPFLAEWRTFTVAGGSLPRDLRDLKPSKGVLPRLEWRKWQECTQAVDVDRVPSFSDYTIQCPIFEEPPSHAPPSASIRYTSYADWVIMRGLSVRRDDAAGYGQWPANAEILSKQAEFMGATFSAGDKYIEETGMQAAHPGNAESWLRAGFNHHITFVVWQLANPFESAAVAGFDGGATPDPRSLPVAHK